MEASTDNFGRTWSVSLIQTKMVPPRLPQNCVPRLALLDRLSGQQRTRSVTVVTAPAGFGKTTLLAGWTEALSEQQQRHCHVRVAVRQDDVMKKTRSLYHGHRFPASIISHAVRWYFRFQLSLRDIEKLLFERGVTVSHESIRRWTDKFGARFAHRIKGARRTPGSTWHLDEMFVTLRGEPWLLWRAIDEHGIELSRNSQT
ncbi:hypothetical protein GGD40_000457 [Paraburkholderia bryophila]|uniref:Transposase n=1 Tax=Paraburkholderia bryophila TaxID=420952 RepID=A0A7Y9WJL9_9BURK|nr:hypothetical protein [Paraburkholderia bryophila]